MSCPYAAHFIIQNDHDMLENEKITLQNGHSKSNEHVDDDLTYPDHIQVKKLFSCLTLQSILHGNTVPDEHFFITVHQTFELWFRQVNFDIDQIRSFLIKPNINDEGELQVVTLLDRIVKIMNLLISQIQVLETMSPLDFLEFRKYLKSASAYQSLQFRLLENKFGVLPEQRVHYNAKNYKEAFRSDDRKKLEQAEEEISLFYLVEKWLENIYHRFENECFWARYLEGVEKYLIDTRKGLEQSSMSEDEKIKNMESFEKFKQNFEYITYQDVYESTNKKDRRFTHDAIKAALIINHNRNLGKFSQAYLILKYLMDMDSLLQKWRYSHVLLVQRMIGNKQGTGKSSGYWYLMTTVGDRYKVFVDLFNLSNYLLPKEYLSTDKNVTEKLDTIHLEGS